MDRDTGSVLDILESARTIMAYLTGISRQDFLQGTQIQDSVIRRLEIIGEAAGRVSRKFRDAHPEIQWSRIRGLRNRMIHGYDDIDMDIVWDTVERDIPRLIEIIELLVPPENR